jgi:MraZ protein
VLFTGEYEHTIDAKHRLAIPAEIRCRLDASIHGEGFYLAPGSNGALWLWPEKTFEQIAGMLDQSLVPEEDMMDFEELLFSQSALLAMDKTGRVRLPDRLIEFAGLKQTVVILGVKDHLELRDPTDWNRRRQEKLAMQGEIMLRARRALTERRRASQSQDP